jgi:hypothetical protein
MNIQRRLKLLLIKHLESNKPEADIQVVDAKRLDEATLPVIAVEITSENAHSQALWNVIVCQIAILYRNHAGDIDQNKLDTNNDAIEQALQNPNIMIDLGSEQDLTIFNFLYQGTTQEWNDSLIDTIFTAQCIVTRNGIA